MVLDMTASLRPSGLRELGSAKRVLVVDDDPDSAELLGVILERAGHETRLALSAEVALEAVAAFTPHVAFIDINLADTDGCELCRSLRAQPELAGCRFVAVTGYSGPEAAARSAAAGFEQHLVKPVSVEALLSAVASGPESQSVAK